MTEGFQSSLDPADLEALKRFGCALTEDSGAIISHYFRTNLTVDTKGDATPVTIADKKVEEILRTRIEKAFPDHGIVGEEFGTHNPEARFKWVLDPIDGTKSFIAGSFDFGTLIALTEDDVPVLGIIHHPILKELMVGDNTTTTLNDAPVHVRPCEHLSDAILLTTDLLTVGAYQDPQGFYALTDQVRFARTYGNCFGYTLVAAGFADIMIDPAMSLWDLMALIPVIKGAGGCITDYHGGDPLQGDSIVACAAGLHDDVIRLLNQRDSATTLQINHGEKQ